jgi:hypothetical protein
MKCIECPYIVKDAEHCVNNESDYREFSNFPTFYVTINYYCGYPASFRTITTAKEKREITGCAMKILDILNDCDWCPLKTVIKE